MIKLDQKNIKIVKTYDDEAREDQSNKKRKEK